MEERKRLGDVGGPSERVSEGGKYGPLEGDDLRNRRVGPAAARGQGGSASWNNFLCFNKNLGNEPRPTTIQSFGSVGAGAQPKVRRSKGPRVTSGVQGVSLGYRPRPTQSGLGPEPTGTGSGRVFCQVM